MTLVLVLLHFAKREFESAFIHRFSNATMPLFNIFKNSIHYWMLSGFLLAVGVYSPFLGAKAVRGTLRDNPTYIKSCIAVWAIAELCNFYSHLILMWLRPKGTRIRQIPRGFAFSLVSCPNYFFEVRIRSHYALTRRLLHGSPSRQWISRSVHSFSPRFRPRK